MTKEARTRLLRFRAAMRFRWQLETQRGNTDKAARCFAAYEETFDVG